MPLLGVSTAGGLFCLGFAGFSVPVLRTNGRLSRLAPWVCSCGKSGRVLARLRSRSPHTKRGVQTILEHIGSAHDDAGLAALVQIAKSKIEGGQGAFDLDALIPGSAAPIPSMSGARSSSPAAPKFSGTHRGQHPEDHSCPQTSA